jgi:hypothetical protein
MLWFFLLALILGLVFGWHVAAVLLVPVADRLHRILAVHVVQAGDRGLPVTGEKPMRALVGREESFEAPG